MIARKHILPSEYFFVAIFFFFCICIAILWGWKKNISGERLSFREL